MKKIITIIFSVALLFPVSAYSAAPCGDFEYAELQDMDQESFIKEYCAARESGRLSAYAAMSSRSRQAKADVDSCLSLIKKMERVYMKRFAATTEEEVKGLCK